MKSEVLKVVDLSAKYHEQMDDIFSDVNFTLYEGEFVLLSGVSGCGKSTLLKTINGILHGKEKLRGEIFINSKPSINTSPTERSLFIGSVLQNADEQIIYEWVEDELAFPLENLNLEPKEMKSRIEEVSEMMQLDLSSKTASLSGGQKQRLITAATLGMKQKILVFDEPLANLDHEGAILLLKHLKRLCTEEGYAVIFAEHRVDLVVEYCDRVFLMEDGKFQILEDVDNIRDHLFFEPNKTNLKVVSKNPLVDPLFTLEKVEYSVKNKKILKGINYTFYKGGKYVISGSNGSGKTTLLHVLAGFYKPTVGKMMASIDTKDFSKVGLVLQNPNYQLFMSSVREELAFQSVSQQYLEELIEIFSLEELLDRHPQSLSEGQKRRVGVAMILSMQPEVLILDELSVGQDLKNMMAMLKAINGLNRQKEITLITVTHDKRCSEFLGDIVIEMKDGQLL